MLINGKDQQVIIPIDEAHLPNIESLIINNRIPDIVVCQQVITDDCKYLISHMLKCQQIIFTDPGFSYQQYVENINIHQQILVKYQSLCENTSNDYLTNDSFDF